jgi:glycosyltransferase involved in cell wall biosynthesis
MKKILYIYGNLPAYREEFFAQLSSRLAEDGVELKVMYGYIANKVTLQAEARDYKTQKFETKLVDLKLFRLSRLEGLMQAVMDERPDGVIFQFNQTNLTEWRILRWCRKNKIPYGIWGCNYTRADLKGFLVKARNVIYNYIYRHSSMCIPYGSKYHDFLVQSGVPEEKVVTAQNTIDVEHIAKREQAFLPKDFNHDTTRIVYVGALAPQKRIGSSIEAVAQLITEGIDLQYDIVGGGTHYDVIKDQWDQLSEETKKRICLHGAKYGADLIPFFRNADVFLMPGTGGLGVNEAMAYGLPIISTEGDETVVDLIEGNGYLLQHMGSVEEQKAAIREFAGLSAAEKLGMSQKSLELVLQKAPLKNMVEKHAIACERMIGLQS